MKHYNCPYCSAYLNLDGKIVLSVKQPKGNSGVIFLSEELGDYVTKLNPKLDIKEGELTHFHCPSCAESLHMLEDENHVRIKKTDKNGEEHSLIFSAIKGKLSTYLISKERQLTFGEHALKYLDPEWYLKD